MVTPVAPSLGGLGSLVRAPDAGVRARATTRLRSTVGTRAGRLGEVAAWWAGVHADERAPAPLRALHLGAEPQWPLLPATAARVDTLPLPRRPADPQLDATDPAPGALLDVALRWAVTQVDAAVDSGVELLLLSVPGTLPAAVAAAALLRMDPVDAVGRPSRSGLDDATWTAQVAGLRDGLVRARTVRHDVGELLLAIGDLPLAAATAALLVAAGRRTPAILDGPGAGAAGLLAREVAETASGWWLAAQGSTQPLHTRILANLRLEPLHQFDLRIEDGTGARLGLAVLEGSALLLQDR